MSHFQFNIYELDFGQAFGDGHVKAFRQLVGGTIVGSVIVMPVSKDSSCEITITESIDALKCL